MDSRGKVGCHKLVHNVVRNVLLIGRRFAKATNETKKCRCQRSIFEVQLIDRFVSLLQLITGGKTWLVYHPDVCHRVAANMLRAAKSEALDTARSTRCRIAAPPIGRGS